MATDFNGPGNPITFGGAPITFGTAPFAAYQFYFPGSTYRTFTKCIVVYAAVSSSSTVTATLYDLLNEVTIATGTGINTGGIPITLTPLSNIPTTSSLWQLTVSGTLSGNTLYSITLE